METRASGRDFRCLSAVTDWQSPRRLHRSKDGRASFITFDPAGNVTQRLNSGLNLLSTAVFDALGTTLAGGGSDPFGFGAKFGYYSDSETGLQLLAHRNYDPAQGRFLNRDPEGFAGGVNPYTYVRNGVPNAVDPFGLNTWRITCPTGGIHGSPIYQHAFLKMDHCGDIKYAGFYDKKHAGAGVALTPHFWYDGLPGVVETNRPGYMDHPDNCDWNEEVPSDDPAFDQAVCECVKRSIAHPPRFGFGYVCGSWITEMIDCGREKAHPY